MVYKCVGLEGELGLGNSLLIMVYLCAGLEGNREGNLGCEIFFLFWSSYVCGLGRGIGRGIGVGEFSSCFGICAHTCLICT
jgi:hypothetical protein